MNIELLPIGPHDHPEPRTMTWTQVELRAIRDYAARCVAAERELWQKDAARLDWLETLLHRTEYQNSRRPAESVSSDMHFAHGKCNLYVRNLFGNAITGAGGSGDSVRAAIDAAIRQAGEKT